MSEQQSQKRGVRSEAQKMDDARQGYDSIGATRRQEGAFGDQAKKRQSDQDTALTQEAQRVHERDAER